MQFSANEKEQLNAQNKTHCVLYHSINKHSYILAIDTIRSLLSLHTVMQAFVISIGKTLRLPGRRHPSHVGGRSVGRRASTCNGIPAPARAAQGTRTARLAALRSGTCPGTRRSPRRPPGRTAPRGWSRRTARSTGSPSPPTPPSPPEEAPPRGGAPLHAKPGGAPDQIIGVLGSIGSVK